MNAECEIDPILDRSAIRILIFIAYTAVFLICLIGNLFTIIVICAHRSMRTATNFFLANLAVADLLVAIFCIFQNMFHLVGTSNARWLLSETSCKLYAFVLHLVPCTGIGILICVSVEKYIAVLHPLLALKVLTPRFRILLMAFIWAASIIFNLPYYIFTKVIFYENVAVCTRFYRYNSTEITDKSLHFFLIKVMTTRNMITCSFVLWYCIPLVILLFLYTRIGLVLWHSAPLKKLTQMGTLRTNSNETATIVSTTIGSGKRKSKRSVTHPPRPKSMDGGEIAAQWTNSAHEFATAHIRRATAQLHSQTVSSDNEMDGSEEEDKRKRDEEAEEEALMGRKRDKRKRDEEAEEEALMGRKRDKRKKDEEAEEEALMGRKRDKRKRDEEAEEEALMGRKRDKRKKDEEAEEEATMDEEGAGDETEVERDEEQQAERGTGTAQWDDGPKTSQGQPKRMRNSEMLTLPTAKDGIATLETINGTVLVGTVESRKKVIRLLIAIVSFFAILTLPHYLRLLYTMWTEQPICLNSLEVLLQPLTYFLLFFSSGCNPFLYAFMSQRFRSAIRDIFKCRRGRARRKSVRTQNSDVVACTTTFGGGVSRSAGGGATTDDGMGTLPMPMGTVAMFSSLSRLNSVMGPAFANNNNNNNNNNQLQMFTAGSERNLLLTQQQNSRNTQQKQTKVKKKGKKMYQNSIGVAFCAYRPNGTVAKDAKKIAVVYRRGTTERNGRKAAEKREGQQNNLDEENGK